MKFSSSISDSACSLQSDQQSSFAPFLWKCHSRSATRRRQQRGVSSHPAQWISMEVHHRFLRKQWLCLLGLAIHGSFLHSFSEWGKVLTASEKIGLEATQSCRCSCVATSAHVSSETELQKFFPALTCIWRPWCHHSCTHLSGHSYVFVSKRSW